MSKIIVQKNEISIIQICDEDYISITDIAHSQMEEHIIIKWLSLKSTIEYIGEWEVLFNPSFNYTEFGTIKNMAGSNNFVLSVKSNGLKEQAQLESLPKQGVMAEHMPIRTLRFI